MGIVRATAQSLEEVIEASEWIVVAEKLAGVEKRTKPYVEERDYSYDAFSIKVGAGFSCLSMSHNADVFQVVEILAHKPKKSDPLHRLDYAQRTGPQLIKEGGTYSILDAAEDSRFHAGRAYETEGVHA